jgi:hypothetical protein
MPLSNDDVSRCPPLVLRCPEANGQPTVCLVYQTVLEPVSQTQHTDRLPFRFQESDSGRRFVGASISPL